MSCKLVHDDVGSTDYKYWEASLSGHTEEDLKRGLKKAQDFKGFLGLGEFRALCKKERNHASHSNFLKLPVKKMEGSEIQRRIRAMKLEMAL